MTSELGTTIMNALVAPGTNSAGRSHVSMVRSWPGATKGEPLATCSVVSASRQSPDEWPQASANLQNPAIQGNRGGAFAGEIAKMGQGSTSTSQGSPLKARLAALFSYSPNVLEGEFSEVHIHDPA